MSKLLAIDIETAFKRAVSGESVRKIARGLRVTEGALRYHFSKGTSPKECRQLAFRLYEANLRRAMLSESDQLAVDRMVAKEMQPRARGGKRTPPVDFKNLNGHARAREADSLIS